MYVSPDFGWYTLRRIVTFRHPKPGTFWSEIDCQESANLVYFAPKSVVAFIAKSVVYFGPKYPLYPSLEAEGCLQALEMAINGRQNKSGLAPIHHSDRGIQYCSAKYVEMLMDAKMPISMTQSGSPYENALAERVNGIIKNEFYPKIIYQNHAQAVRSMQKIIRTYNELRPHSSLDYLTPNQAHVRQGAIVKRWKQYRKSTKQKEVTTMAEPE